MALQQQIFPGTQSGGAVSGQPTYAVVLCQSETENVAVARELQRAGLTDVQPVNRALRSLDSVFLSARKPDLVFVGAQRGAAEDLDVIRKLNAMRENQSFRIVALVERGSEYAAMQAAHAGAEHFLATPILGDEISNLLGELVGNSKLAGGGSGKKSKIVVFAHVTGGAGATTLAVNVGCALSQEKPHRETCLMDLDMQFGAAASFLDLNQVSPITDFMEDPSRIDTTMLEGMMVQHPSGLQVLTAPRAPVPLHALRPNAVADLLRVAAQRYQNIVVDLPVALAPWTDTVLGAADVIYLVTPMTVPAAHQVTRFLNLLRTEKLGDLPIKLVVNREGGKNAEISVTQFAKAVGQALEHVLPDDPDLMNLAHNQGTPAVRLKPKSRFSQAVQKMVDQDINQALTTRSRKFGLFSF